MTARIPPVTLEEHESALKKGPNAVDYCMYLFYDKVNNAPGSKYVQRKLSEWFYMKGMSMKPPRRISFIRGCQMILENNERLFARDVKK